jgi:hypothetical protein
MNIGTRRNSIRVGVKIACLSLCLASTNLLAADPSVPMSVIAGDTLGLISDTSQSAPDNPDSFTLMIDRDAGLDFDLGGSDTRKLQLQLNQPLSLSTGSSARVLDNGSNILGLDATLNAPLSDSFSLSAGVGEERGEARFQSLGSIQCMNGVLRADSYTASGCRFVNEPLASTESRQINLGARLDFSNASASINWFTQDSNMSQSRVQHANQIGSQAIMGQSLLSPNLGNPLLATPGANSLQYLNSEASGVNLNFKVGYATDKRGDFRLGLAFTRVLEAGYQGGLTNSAENLSWTLAEPFNSASMNLEWSKGSFSSGIQGYYRDSVDFLHRNSVDSLTTFDVHFTWRTPWNANLSVGASNVLNAGSESTVSTDSKPVDPLESIYGRIPYVRYKQDL